MTTIHGHFDGKRVVLDEPLPVTLAVGQRVRVVLDSAADPTGSTPPTSQKSIAERASEPSFSPHADPVAALMQGGILAVSDEPEGGSPTGAPTGDILATAPFADA